MHSTDPTDPQCLVPAFSRTGGQPARLSVRNTLGDLAEELVSFDRGFLHTATGLVRGPSRTLQRWIVERDARLCRPFRFLLIALTVSFALQWLAYALDGRDAEAHGATGSFVAGLLDGMQGGSKPQQGVEEPSAGPAAASGVISWINERAMWWALLLVPLIASAMHGTFRGYDINFAEHWVISSYAFAMASLAAGLVSLLVLPIPQFAWLEPIIFGGVLVRTLAALPEVPRPTALGRTLGAVLLACLALFFFAMAVTSAYLTWTHQV